MKKILAVVVALVMLASVFTVAVSAEGKTLTFKATAGSSKAGEVTLAFSIPEASATNNVATFSMVTFNYDASKLEKPVASFGAGTNSGEFDIATDASAGKVEFMYLDGDAGEKNDDSGLYTYIQSSAAFITFTFKTKAGVTSADFTVVPDEAGNATNGAMDVDYVVAWANTTASATVAAATTKATTTPKTTKSQAQLLADALEAFAAMLGSDGTIDLSNVDPALVKAFVEAFNQLDADHKAMFKSQSGASDEDVKALVELYNKLYPAAGTTTTTKPEGSNPDTGATAPIVGLSVLTAAAALVVLKSRKR